MTLRATLAWALTWCSLPIAGAQPQGKLPLSVITSIRLERDCFGCATGGVFAMNQDGTATHTLTGKARHGTVETTSRGVLQPGAFEQLAQLLSREGFFELKDVYEAADIRDGAWTTVTVTRGGQDKQVFSREDAGPPALKRVEAAIDAARARMVLKP